MKLNKILCLILTTVLVVAFAGCQFITPQPTPATTFTVAFDSVGGTAVPAQTVESGKTAIQPASPTKDGYTFEGWLNNGAAYNFATPVTANITLTASWKQNAVKPTEYTISYYDGSTKLSLTPATYTSESTGLALPAGPAKAGYAFIGWYSDAALTTKVNSIDVTAAKNLTLYAGYEAVVYEINYHLNGGTANNPAFYTVNDLPLTIADPTKDGYEFKGWFTEYTLTTAYVPVTAATAGNLELFAKWEEAVVPPTEYTITYLDKDGNAITGLEPATYVESASTINLPSYTAPDGWKFLGWTAQGSDEIVQVIPAGTTGNLTYVAKVEENIVTYKLSYMLDGKPDGQIEFNNAEGVTLKPIIKDGYTFSGWTILGGDGEVVTAIPANYGKDVVVMGTLTPIEYTITYVDSEGNTIVDPKTYTILDSASALKLADGPARDGYEFKGWYIGETSYTELKAGTIGDFQFTAKYEKITYKIVYYLYGGDNSTLNETEYVPGEPAPALFYPTRDGYLFGGWYTSANYGEENLVESLDELVADPDVTIITLYAMWTPITSENGGGDTLTPPAPM